MNYARRLDRRASLRKQRRSAVKDQIRHGLFAERLEDRTLMAADAISPFLASFHSDYWNSTRPTDVNNDTSVAPNDALAIINVINSQGSYKLPQGAGGEGESASSRMFVDTNNDGWISPADALKVINELNGEGAGELAAYTIRTVAAGTNTPISTIQVGQDYDLQVTVRDLRGSGSPRGVFAAYMDLFYGPDATQSAALKPLTSVRVAEIQTVTLNTGIVDTGSFTLTFNGQTTAPITYDIVNDSGDAIAARIASALAALPNIGGASNIQVIFNSTDSNWQVRFIGAYDVDEPLMTGSSPAGTTITIAELVKGDPTNANSFTEAFRSFPSPNATGNPPTPGPYQNGVSATNLADRIDDLGAFGGLTPTGTGVQELVRARMHANAAGTLVFTPDFSQLVSPAHDNLLYVVPGTNANLAASDILVTVATLTINTGPINAQPDTPAAVNEGSGPLTVNVLANDTKNNGAPAGALQVLSFTQPASGGAVTRQNATDFTNGNLIFTPTSPDFNGTITYTYTVGIVGDANVNDQATQTVTITYNAVNDAPVVNLPGAQTATEDTAKVINGISVTDVDADPAGVQVTLASTTGTVTLSGVAGLNFSAGDGTSDATMTFTGTTTAINTALTGLTFKGNQDFNGAASLVVTVNDQGNTGSGGALQDSKTLAISVSAVNDAPVVTAPAAQSTTFVQDLVFSTGTGNGIVISDPDAGSGQIKVTLAVGGGIGTLSATASGSAVIGGTNTNLTITGTLADVNATLNGLKLTPPAQTIVSGTLTVTADDQGNTPPPAQTGNATINIDIVPPIKPFALNDAFTFAEGSGAQTFNVLGNDLSNSPSKPAFLSATSFTQPPAGKGTVTFNDNGTPTDFTDDKLVYTPPADPNFFTPASVSAITFTYTINESPSTGGADSTGTVSVRITNVPDVPVATADLYQTAIGVALTRNAAQGVLANDTDVDNNFGDANVATLSVLAGSVTTPTKGTVTVGSDGSFTYTPNAGASGDDTFNYRTHSSLGPDSTPATVTIHIAAPPVAVADTYTTAQEDQAFVSPTSVLANDTDPTENQTLTAVLDSNVPAAAGSVTLNTNGTFTYNPAPNFNTTRPAGQPPITFTYHATASGRDSNVVAVSITVNEVNDNPTAVNDTYLAVKQQGGGIGVDQIVPVLGNDSIAPDVGETLTVTAVNGGTGPSATPKGGSVRLSGGQILYTSPTTVTTPGNPDTFTYTISDGRGGTATATVSVDVVDFVPKTISGKVYIDLNKDGQINTGESPVAGVTVQLTGTDFQNNLVSLSAVTDINGNYIFPDPNNASTPAGFILKPPKPGTSYTITEVQPLYLLNGLDTDKSTNNADEDSNPNTPPVHLVTNASATDNIFTARWLITDLTGNITGLNFGENGIDTSSLGYSGGFKTEFLASTLADPTGFYLATGLTGANLWSFSLPGWDVSSLSATLSSDLSILTISGVKNGSAFSVDIPAGLGSGTFRILGYSGSSLFSSGNQYILRIEGSLSNFLAAAQGAGGEGEAPVNRDFSGGADAVFAEQAWA